MHGIPCIFGYSPFRSKMYLEKPEESSGKHIGMGNCVAHPTIVQVMVIFVGWAGFLPMRQLQANPFLLGRGILYS